MRLVLFALAIAPPAVFADDSAMRRALIERDQQSAEFAAGARRGELETLRQRQLLESTTVRQPAAYQRERMKQDRDAVLLHAEPAAASLPTGQAPLPLPGGPVHVVEPIPAYGLHR